MYFGFKEKRVTSKFYSGEPKKEKDYYAIINYATYNNRGEKVDKSFVVDYSTRFRSQAIAYFNEEAKLAKGLVDYVGVYN